MVRDVAKSSGKRYSGDTSESEVSDVQRSTTASTEADAIEFLDELVAKGLVTVA